MISKAEQFENVKKWTTALRSGEYQQGYKVLKDGSKFCCLGVACDILDIEHTKRLDINFYGIEQRSGLLPKKASDLLGITDDGETGNIDFPTLHSMNDSGTYTFAQIADYIDANYEKLHSFYEA
jgi:hypothetical protein